MKKNSVYIIIVTYNGIQWLDKCLKSCKGPPIIEIDNTSTDDTCKFIETNFSSIVLLKQNKNLGFGQANNIDISFALNPGAEHVLLLNQDAYLLDDSLVELIGFQKNNTEYGIFSPIHITNKKNKLDKNFSTYMLKEITGQFYSHEK